MTIAGLACAAWIALGPAPPADDPVPAPSVAPAPQTHADAPDAPVPVPTRAVVPASPDPPPAPAASLSDPEAVRKRSLRLSGAVLLAIPVLGEALWWRNEETEGFHWNRENWFGRDTYAGGADKVSHVFGGYAVARELALGFEKLGNSPARSRALATGLTVLSGVLVEGGDGFSIYGYSWEDVFSDVVGAGLAAGIGAAKADDLIGVRFGFVKADKPPTCCRAAGRGSDYSREIYSFDLKLDGALKRLGVAKPGPGRFLLVSLTYGSKGYRFSPVEVRQRNVGVDVGLNVVEVLKAVGVRENTWWGQSLIKLFTYYRLRYTAWGWRYDFNHHKWSGFGTGSEFDPGRVIYQ